LFPKYIVPLLILASPASLLAQSPAATHEIVTMTGKSTVHVRPLAQQQSRTVHCHPDAGKSVTCEAHARTNRAQELARADAAKADRVAQR
jgi:hypothetical protein